MVRTALITFMVLGSAWGQAYTGKHVIEPAAARKMIKAWQDAQARYAIQGASAEAFSSTTAMPLSVSYKADAIKALLAQPGADGLRAYNALAADGHHTLVLVAYDAKGTELPLMMEYGTPCPPFCKDAEAK